VILRMRRELRGL